MLIKIYSISDDFSDPDLAPFLNTSNRQRLFLIS